MKSNFKDLGPAVLDFDGEIWEELDFHKGGITYAVWEHYKYMFYIQRSISNTVLNSYIS